MSRMERLAGFAAGVLTGAAVGVGLALLFAPKPGADLRSDIGHSVDSLRGAVSDRYRQLAARAGTGLDHLHHRIDRATDTFEASASDVIHNTARRVRELNRAHG